MALLLRAALTELKPAGSAISAASGMINLFVFRVIAALMHIPAPATR
jgi:hypothetical protein